MTTDDEFSTTATALSARISEVIDGQDLSVVVASLGSLFGMALAEFGPQFIDSILDEHLAMIRRLVAATVAEKATH